MFLHSLQAETETHPASYPTGSYFSLEVKRPEYEVDGKSE